MSAPPLLPEGTVEHYCEGQMWKLPPLCLLARLGLPTGETGSEKRWVIVWSKWLNVEFKVEKSPVLLEIPWFLSTLTLPAGTNTHFSLFWFHF